MSAAAHRMTLFSRCNIRALLLLLAPVAGLTWIRKRTIVLDSGRRLPESSNRTGPEPGIADALKDEPINHTTLTWEATAPRRTDARKATVT